MIRKELYWFLATLSLSLIINFALFGAEGFTTTSSFDINIYDTYFIIPTFYGIIALSVLIFFGTYLARSLKWNFKNLISNIILMMSTMALILVVARVSVSLTVAQATGFSGDLSLDVVQDKTTLNEFGGLSNSLFIIQIVLLLFLAFCGFKTGRYYRINRT